MIRSCPGIVLMAFCFFFQASGLHAEDCVLRSAWEEWRPYQYRNEDGVLAGLDIELMQTVFREMGCSIHFEELLWKGALARIRDGSLDFIAGASPLPDREAYAHFSMPYRTETFVLIVRRGETGKYALHTLADLVRYPLTIGATHAYYYGADFEKLLLLPEFRSRISFVNADILNYRMLLHGRIYGFLMDPVVAGWQLDADRVENYPGIRLESGEICVMFSRRRVGADFVEKFNRELDRIRKSGQYDRIYSR